MTGDTTKKSRGFPMLASALLVSVGLLFLLHALWMQHLKREMEILLDGWRDFGLPATPAELETWSNRPVEGVNAADLYDEAFAALTERGERGYALGDFVRKAPHGAAEETLRVVREYVDQNEQALALLRDAAATGTYVRPVEFDGVELTLSSSIQDTMKSARLLSAAAKLAVLEGDWPRVADRLCTLLSMGRAVGTEQLLISQLVSLASESIALAAIEDALGHGTMPKEIALALAGCLEESTDRPKRMASGLIGEICLQTGMFEAGLGEDFSPALFADPKFTWVQEIVSLAYTVTGIQDLDYLRLLEFEASLYHALQADPADLPAELEAVKRREEGTSRVLVATVNVTAGFVNAAYKSVEQQATVRAARVALAVHRYILEQGRHPRALDDLVPDYLDRLPPDPFSGESLRYAREENGYAIYSVGRNGKDDGGVADDPSTSGPEDDVVFRVER